MSQSAQELKKIWLSPKPRRKQAKKTIKKKTPTPMKVNPPKMGDTVSLFFEARNCCVPDAKAGLDCRHDAVVVGLNSKMFKAKCMDGSKWDVVIMKKRTGLFPKGDWTHQSAAAAAYAGVEQEAQSDDDL